jgi:polyhydroxyalkanoate synthesis regulator phasin
MAAKAIVKAPNKPPENGKAYDPAEVDQVLLQLAANGGVLKKTMEQTGVSMTTLSKWKNKTHIERYNELCRSHGNELKIRTLASARERIGEIDATQRKYILELDRMVEAGDLTVGDASKALDALTRAKKAEHEAVASMEQRPQIIQVEHNASGAMKRLAAAGMLRLPEVVEATAEEITE